MTGSDNGVASAASAASRHPRSTKEQILQSAVALFSEQGFEATSLRQIASAVGIEAGSLYNHISSKQDLLFQLMRTAMDDIIANVEVAVSRAGADPARRLAAAVRAHVVFYCVNRRQALVGERELRSLTRENFVSNRAQRRHYEDLFIAILEDGVQASVFRSLDTHVAAYGILGMCSNVAVWFRPGGRLARDEVADIYVDMALQSVLTYGQVAMLEGIRTDLETGRSG